MRKRFAVLVTERKSSNGGYVAASLGIRSRPQKAFIVEAETAKKAENQVKRSEQGKGFDVLYAVEADVLPIEIQVSIERTT